MTPMSFIVEVMVTQSLSGIVLIVLALLVLIGIVPLSTMRSQRNASRHFEDKYSSSLHVIDDDAAAVRDELRVLQKERFDAAKQEANALRFTAHRVNRMRALRRSGIRHRRILTMVLLVATIAVPVCAYLWNFSYWWSAFPAALLLTVLGFGITQARRARLWEEELKQYRVASSSHKPNGITRFDLTDVHAHNAQSNAERATEQASVQSVQKDKDNNEPLFTVDTVKTIEFNSVDIEHSAHSNRDNNDELDIFVPQTHNDQMAHEDDSYEVLSREIVSARQVAQAVPPTHTVHIPSSDDAANRADKEQVDVNSILEMRRQ